MKKIAEKEQTSLTDSVVLPVTISPFISKDDKRYVTAWHGKKITDYPEKEAEKAVMVIISTAYAELGQKIGGGTKEQRLEFLLTTTKLLINDIRYYTPGLTLEDLKIATELGLRNHYGEYIGFNVITLHNFIEKYLNSRERCEALRKQQKFIEDQLPKPPLSGEEKDQLRVECLRVCYRNFRENGFVIDCGAVNYRFLIERGEINLTIDEKIAIYDRAKIQVDAEAIQKAVSFSEIIQKMRDQFEDVTGYQIRSREIVLKQYFSTITPERLEEIIQKYLEERRTDAN